jgi:4-alpha-glucanotransferase
MTDAWSITEGYNDVRGGWHPTSDETRQALHLAMGAEGASPPAPPPMWFVHQGEHLELDHPCDVALEDGTYLSSLAELPPDLPLGYHDLQPLDGGSTTRLVVSPGRCPLPGRMWGWAAQLYSLRSGASWGMGDLADLRHLAAWTASLGGRVMMINPLHANPPCVPQQPSPYFASSRIWRNPLYLRIGEVGGVTDIAADLAALDAAGRALDGGDRIDRDATFHLKMQALELLFDRFEDSGRGREAFETWRDRQDQSLRPFATYCALAERYGPNFREWSPSFAHPSSPAVEAFQDAEGRRIRFHEWCQWLVAGQLTGAGATGVALMADVAVGFDPSGADGWVFQDLLAEGCRVGAPPDIFSPDGQDWGLPPFVPWRLQMARYEPFIATIRSAFVGCGAIRLDHVMGLFRLYWIPPDHTPHDGAYVRYTAAHLLDLLALEATRAGAFVVGEDLGTVEDEVRDELAERNVLSYKLLWFEEGPTADLPPHALAAVTTHDLSTTAGVWTGADQAARISLGFAEPGEPDPFEPRLRELTGLDEGAPVDDVVLRTHEALVKAPSLVVLATLEDAVASPDRPNFPGTIDEWPNWRIPLPATLEELTQHPLALALARVLDEGMRTP